MYLPVRTGREERGSIRRSCCNRFPGPYCHAFAVSYTNALSDTSAYADGHLYSRTDGYSFTDS